MNTHLQICPLCSENHRINQAEGPGKRIFLECGTCRLIFILSKFHPSPEEEKNRYLKHQNNFNDPEYAEFLNKAIKPALKYIKPGSSGLDYGCGHIPALSLLLKKHGISCDNYDPFFFPELKTDKQYDFIFIVESAEHFFYPGKEFDQITALLMPEGILVLMTQLWKEEKDFKNWWYARDITHVSFYHQDTIDYICKSFNLKMGSCNEPGVFILKKGQK